MSSRSLIKNSALAAIDMVTTTACAIVASVLVGRLLGPAKLGHYNYVLWIANFSVALANFGVPSAVGKYAAEFLGQRRPGFAAAIVRTGYRYQLVSGVAVFGAGTAIALLVEDRSHLSYVLPVVVSLPLTMLMAVSTQGNVAMERFDANVIPSIAGSVLNVVGVLLTLFMKWDLPGLAVALLFAKAVDSGLRYVAFRRLYASRLKELGSVEPEPLPDDTRKRFIRFCGQSTVLVLINLVVWNRSEMFFLRRFCDIRQVAFYSVSFGLAQTVINAVGPFSTAVAARLMVQHSRDRVAWQRTTWLFMRFQMIAVIPLAFGLAALAGPLLLLTYGRAYAEAVPVLAIAALLCPPAALAGPAQSAIAAADRQGFSVRWGLTMVLVTLALDWLLVWGWGAVGAAVANGIAQAIMVTGLWVYVFRHATFRPPTATFWRVVLSGVVMVIAVRAACYSLPLGLQLPLGVVGGALAYGMMLRIMRVFSAEDHEVLCSLVSRAPRLLRRPLVAGIVALVPPSSRGTPDQLLGQA